MRSFVLISALLLCNWVSVSGSEFQTVQVQPGQEVTLLCRNISTSPTHTFWSRFTNRTRISCISSMYKSDSKPSFCHGFQNGKYEMSSNVSTVFLTIKQVDLSDSGLYLCGFYINGHTIIHVEDVTVQGSDESNNDSGGTSQREPNAVTELMSVILAAAVTVTVVLIMTIIALAVKYRKLQTAHKEQSQQNQNLHSEDLNYAALSFHPKANRNRRPASDRQLEPNVVYAATR
ncbi:uncharacterized protein LOC113122378 [Mastacembelus armatus]|uniref:uncharacterized protein LOC113122378 n=1 Tax=Mastacembelus armatus TaxID=205130 RepID=UPI000E4560C8|nr:uncharacterized protein LOC113122378 [Mastacembelus armatus]